MVSAIFLNIFYSTYRIWFIFAAYKISYKLDTSVIHKQLKVKKVFQNFYN